MAGFDYYDGVSNSIKHMALGVIVWVAERTECQALTYTMKEGIYRKVSGWAANVSEVYLPACQNGFSALVKDMLNGTSTHRQYNKCCKRSFETNPECTINEEVKNL